MPAEKYTFGSSTPDDLRAQGWRVAVHNDYKLNGMSYTFWCFTKDEIATRKWWEPLKAMQGEGRTDAEALDKIRVALHDGEDIETRRK